LNTLINEMIAFGFPSGMEWIWLLLIVLLFFGAAKLPELARGLALAIKEFKKASKEVTDELDMSGDAKSSADRKNKGDDTPSKG
jgi:sec-independent protein translocase protein TatA